MSDPHISEGAPASESSEEMTSALFAHLVVQQSSMATMLLCKTVHPETGKVVRDLEGAKLFIDMLEMLEAKTKGNLSQEEAGLLRQTLMSLRLTFVEAADMPAEAEAPTDRGSSPAKSGPAPGAAKPEPAPSAAPAEEKHRTKFTKKY